MKRVTGIGGIFFKSKDPKVLTDWYASHLGIPLGEHGEVMFKWRGAEPSTEEGVTVWAPFPEDTDYFEPTKAAFMVNYRVDDLDALLEALTAEGVEIDPKRDDSEYGRFAWITDPEGNRIELWEPPKEEQTV
ncbi:MAG: Glyoxalase/Bleomycin resistance protein/Dioxygenase family protein [Capsulimonas sp.]|jgi:predicted enzyme related to lactoylglutathione lyase|nr:Glyoxalase/Bleomycin resistance protein/Dioxygenase family protein [Capsulimonas sp.]